MAPFKNQPTLGQVSTYLFGVCLFSISFLVFLNSSVSFVITDIIGQTRGVGDAVGNLGFADELVAIVACPLWGMVSDRLGFRIVTVIGYLLIGLALVLFVQASNVYPQLLLARMFFALGGAASTTMVTATLPCISYNKPEPRHQTSHSYAQSEASDDTVTPANWSGQATESLKPSKPWYQIPGPRLAGFVGAFTGCGALIALTCFLPLPSLFQKQDHSPANALKETYYIVSAIAFVVSVACFFGLRNLRGQEDKGWNQLWLKLPPSGLPSLDKENLLPYWQLFYQSVRAASHPDIGLGYIGGFVARASSVGISLFIPLLVNNYFISSGRCKVDDTALIKTECREAYVLAAKLTGVSQLIALLLAPAYGYFSDSRRRIHIPLLLAAIAGIAGYSALSLLVDSPDPASERGSALVYLWVSLIGASQIGAIVCSLGSISRGIAESNPISNGSQSFIERQAETDEDEDTTAAEAVEHAPLLSSSSHAESDSQAQLNPSTSNKYHSSTVPPSPNLKHLQGSIAGTYSLCGGAAILLLTKLGGALFDSVSVSAPFVILLLFNVLLLLAVLGHAGLGFARR